jgi:hypothetical protein
MGSKWKMRDKSDIWRQPWPGRLTPESPPHLSLTCESPSNDGARGIPSPHHHYTDDFLRSTMKLFLMVTPPAARIQVTTDSLHRPFSLSGRLRHDVGAGMFFRPADSSLKYGMAGQKEQCQRPLIDRLGVDDEPLSQLERPSCQIKGPLLTVILRMQNSRGRQADT